MAINVILVIIIVLVLIILNKYNKFIKLRNSIKQAASGIDVYLNKRFDLIPNLVECVKSYTEYESDTLEKIVEKRAEYNQTKGLDVKKAEEINSSLNSIIAVAENNPNLKASEQYVNLQKNLAGIENELQAARRIYNISVTSYNNYVEIFPSNIVAGLFGFKKEELFKIDEEKKENIETKI